MNTSVKTVVEKRKGYSSLNTKYEGMDKSTWSATCYVYQHTNCKGSNGTCKCPCHDKGVEDRP